MNAKNLLQQLLQGEREKAMKLYEKRYCEWL